MLNNYAHIFDLLIRLRQAVDHPFLVVYSASGGKIAPPPLDGADRARLPLCFEHVGFVVLLHRWKLVGIVPD